MRVSADSAAQYRKIIATGLTEKLSVTRVGVFTGGSRRAARAWSISAYVVSNSGPFAVLHEDDIPAMLAHADSLMAEPGQDFGAVTPLLNEKTVRYFIERKYQIDSFSTTFMSNVPFSRFENYLCFGPEFFR